MIMARRFIYVLLDYGLDEKRIIQAGDVQSEIRDLITHAVFHEERIIDLDIGRPVPAALFREIQGAIATIDAIVK